MKNPEFFTKKIISYEKDIEKLNEMIELYESTKNIEGSLYNDLISEIYAQVDYCEVMKSNLTEKLKTAIIRQQF